ncbi:hypothetical protein [Marivirga sp.]|uniref:hypothetical protein n=1 Tax=Marivirga sp. TaxID=2018662 RepID=UPI002D7E1856|nr:hypothetical protein [Marivirga sp.]HET8859974.1 hypothetical protein [Marivirga sp.]
MRFGNIVLICILLFIFSCSSKQEKTESKSLKKEKKQTVQKVESRKPDSYQKQSESKAETEEERSQNNCDEYFKKRFPKDSVKALIIDQIISRNSDSLSPSNLKFLKALKTQEKDLAFKHALNPVFRLNEDELGIVFYPQYKRTETSLISLSKEPELIEKHDTIDSETLFFMNEMRFHPQILDSIYADQEKPQIYYYTPNRMDSARIKDLGKFYGECQYYYEYSIQDSLLDSHDSLLIASSLKLKLEFEGDSKVDSLIAESFNESCLDCPSSEYLLKSFARLKGVDNLYFSYADTFPINDELETPARALIYVQENEFIYLWYSEVDLFGCSCL